MKLRFKFNDAPPALAARRLEIAKRKKLGILLIIFVLVLVNNDSLNIKVIRCSVIKYDKNEVWA